MSVKIKNMVIFSEIISFLLLDNIRIGLKIIGSCDILRYLSGFLELFFQHGAIV
jgi:hypothetical protein